jgi:GxxExxY protein
MEHEVHKDSEGLSGEIEAIARQVVDAGLTVHRVLGAGLLESAYEHCLAYELQQRHLPVRRQVPLPIIYKGTQLDAGYLLDLLVADAIIVEVKSTESVSSRLFEAQVLTYLKLSGKRLAFLMNFSVPLFRDGLRRYVC